MFRVFVAVYEGSVPAHGVSTGRLDLDDIRAHVGHELAAVDAHRAG